MEQENINDEEFYLIATKEVIGDGINQALWAKCMAINMGDEHKSKYDYINRRVEILKKEAQAAEEKKIADAKAAEEKKIADAKAAEEKKIADAKAAEEKKIADAKSAEEQRIADAKAFEEQRIADVKAALEKKIADSNTAEEQRIAVFLAAQEQRIAGDQTVNWDKESLDPYTIDGIKFKSKKDMEDYIGNRYP